MTSTEPPENPVRFSARRRKKGSRRDSRREKALEESAKWYACYREGKKQVIRFRGKSEKDKDRKETILWAFAADLKPLADIMYEAIDRYLAGVEGSVGNKKKHLSAISVFVAWLLKKTASRRIRSIVWTLRPPRGRTKEQ